MAQRVLLHVGAPKTGTSFVQDILFHHRDALRDEGFLYPADRHDAHFLAALDLMELPWGGLEEEAVGAWDRLAAEVRAFEGTAIISHEILGSASRGHVARALASLGQAEVHVMVSARDLVRQIPAEWQENVKHRRVLDYATFLRDVCDPSRPSDNARWFWAVQEVPDVLERWGATLPREQVHLVTVPRPGAPRGLLWERFASLLGIDPERWQPFGDRPNVSLGVPEAAMIRRLNEQLNHVLPNHHYRTFVREMLVHRYLSSDSGSPRIVVPPDVFTWAEQLSRSWVAELALRAYDVVGDLDELLPETPEAFTDPDQPDEERVADAAIRSLALVVRETARLSEVERDLNATIADLSGQLDRFYGTRSFRTKQKIVEISRTNGPARAGLGVYRRLRGNNSRST